jgi:hypothetical protein
VLYFVVAPMYSPIGLVDKVIEVALVAMLLTDASRARSEPAEAEPGAGPAVG